MRIARPASGWSSLRARWLSLTREGRDTLWLLGMLALVLAPHAPRVPWWASAGAALALLWRARLAWLDAKLPRRWLLVLLLIALMALTWLTYRTLIGREAGITLVVVLTTLKCLELRARRDSLVCLYLGFFLILTQFFYSQGIGTAALMLLGVWGLLTALILGQRPLGRPGVMEVGREAARSMLWGLPLMVLLFLLFPRFGPLWALPSDARGRTGLSDTLMLGQVAELAQDDSIALRVRFLQRVPPATQMYFRGPTLERFDGRTWKPGGPTIEPSAAAGSPLPYEITIEPNTLQVIPLIDGTVQAKVTAGGSDKLVIERMGQDWLRHPNRPERMVLEARAWPRWRWNTDMSERQRRFWTALPPGLNPRTSAWAVQLRDAVARRMPEGAGPPPASLLADAVMRHIRTAGYSYTLSPGLPAQPTAHLIDDFWMDRRAGFCEHFATAFVVVMRSMGVPARVVTGYQGAEFNPVDGQYIVRNSSAHAWAEFWQVGQGWVRADPTAAVAPERVERVPRVQPFAGLPGPLSQLDPGALRRLRDIWDAVDNRWNVWVLQYARDQQMALLASLGWPRPDMNTLLQALGWGIGALGLGAAMFAWVTRERNAGKPWQAPLHRIHTALLQAHEPAPPGLAPAAASAWRATLLQAWPTPHTARQAALLRLLQQVDALRYGARAPSSGDAIRASQWLPLVRQIEALCKPAAGAGAGGGGGGGGGEGSAAPARPRP